MIQKFDVYYDKREDKAYYADIVTPEVTVLRPILVPSLDNALARNSGCMISRRTPGNMNDCKMVLTDIAKLIPLDDLGELNYSQNPYIKIGVLQGERCMSLFENAYGMSVARMARLKFQEKLKKEHEEKQKAFDQEMSSRGTTNNAENVKTHTYDHPESGSRIIVSEIRIPKSNLDAPRQTHVADKTKKPAAKKPAAKKPTAKKPAAKKPASKGRSKVEKLGPTGPTKN